MSVAYRPPESDPVASAAVNTERVRALAAEAANQAAVAAEVTARGADVDDEMTRAEAAEAAAVASAAAATSAEQARALAAEGVVAGNVTAEASARAAADSAEAAARAAGDVGLDARLDTYDAAGLGALFVGATEPTVGTPFIWFQTDAAGALLDIRTGP